MRVIINSTFQLCGLVALATLYSSSAIAAGLPQLDFATFPPQLIWLVITFCVLMFFMTRFIIPKISEVLEERQHRIDDNLKRAENFQSSAEVAASAYKRTLADAHAAAHKIVLDANKSISDNAAKKQDELSREMELEIKSAESRIMEEKKVAMQGINEVASEIALDIAEKVYGKRLSEQDAKKLVDEVIEENK